MSLGILIITLRHFRRRRNRRKVYLSYLAVDLNNGHMAYALFDKLDYSAKWLRFIYHLEPKLTPIHVY